MLQHIIETMETRKLGALAKPAIQDIISPFLAALGIGPSELTFDPLGGQAATGKRICPNTNYSTRADTQQVPPRVHASTSL